MLNIIKFAAKLALQNPKVREGIRKLLLNLTKKLSQFKKNIDCKKTSNKSPFKNFKSFKKI